MGERGVNYYNEWDPYAAQWLRNLIAEGLIPKGEFDERSIKDVRGSDLAGFTQCHFFAGIGGWSYALRLAGWPEDREAWTGSCPCQPFSVAGKRKGVDDERHLWPEFARLIKERKPSVVFGEQVAAASSWLAGVRSDLEEMDYAVGAIPIEAASGGAPQYRDRFWFVAGSERAERRPLSEGWKPIDDGTDSRREEAAGRTGECGQDSSFALPLPDQQRESNIGIQRSGKLGRAGGDSEDHIGIVAAILGPRLEGQQGQPGDPGSKFEALQRSGLLRLERPPVDGWGEGWTESEFRSRGFTASVASSEDSRIQFIECPDGKFRRLPPPRVRWLGNGIPSRVAKLRAYGNAIVPQTAALFVRAYLDAQPL
jgi:DNA (cytosine-5)-methyltransferase 1